MKIYSLILILTVYCSSLKADCFDYGTHVIWPLGKVISNNSLIIINSGDSNFIKGILKSNLIYLKSINDKQRIPLTLIQICDGGLNFKQLILKSSLQLVENKEYGLYYSKQSRESIRKNYNSRLKQNDILIRSWFVKNNFDIVSPTWEEQPVIQRKFYVRYGCGPEIKVYLSYSAFDQSPIIIKAIIKHKVTGKITTCFIGTKDGKIELGHHMCWGEFEFNKEDSNDKEEYEVTFNLIDECGNISKNSESINFIQPNQTDME